MPISYDGALNPLSYVINGSECTLTWTQGRRLASISGEEEGTDYTYTYNDEGIRTGKTVNGVEHIYHLSGTQILSEEWTENGVQYLIVYSYDASGYPISMTYRKSTDAATAAEVYFLATNLQGDVTYIYDIDGNRVVTYNYDAWGNILSISGTKASTIGRYNPFRYRGYYYDTETGFYYLNSRYYDPEIGRWINADGYVSTGQGVLGNNMFAYCGNNPVNRKDPTGQFWITALIVTAVAVVCTVTLSGCSAQPTSDVGAAKPYVDMPGSDDPTSPNCYAYAIGSPVNEQPGGTSGRIPTKWNDVNDVGKSVEADLKAKGHTVREISGPDAKVYDNEFKIALRVGTQPYAYNQYTGQLYYDYHFMRQTNTGQWAEKHGYGGASILWDAGMTPETIPWTLGGVPYYDSAIIYYAVGN